MVSRRDVLKGLLLSPLLAKNVNADRLEAEAIERILKSLYLVNTHFDYNLGDEKKEGVYQGVAIAYDNSLLTLSHITKPEEIPIQMGNYHVVRVPINVKGHQIEGQDLEAIVDAEETDLAVYKLPKGFKGKRYPFGLGDSDEIYYTQPVLIIGNPGLEGVNVRNGEVSSKVRTVKEIAEDGSESHRTGFYISQHLYPGDSGSPLIDRERFGRLLGLNAESHGGRGFVRPINLFKPYLK